MMTEGQRQTLHQLLDKMIDDGMEYGVCEYAVIPDDIEMVKTPDPLPSIWEINRIRMEMTLLIRNKRDTI